MTADPGVDRDLVGRVSEMILLIPRQVSKADQTVLDRKVPFSLH